MHHTLISSAEIKLSQPWNDFFFFFCLLNASLSFCSDLFTVTARQGLVLKDCFKLIYMSVLLFQISSVTFMVRTGL